MVSFRICFMLVKLWIVIRRILGKVYCCACEDLELVGFELEMIPKFGPFFVLIRREWREIRIATRNAWITEEYIETRQGI